MCAPTTPPASAVIKKKKSIADEELFPGARLVSLIFIWIAAAIAVAPLLYMISLAFQSDAEVSGGSAVLIPAKWQWENIGRLFAAGTPGGFPL